MGDGHLPDVHGRRVHLAGRRRAGRADLALVVCSRAAAVGRAFIALRTTALERRVPARWRRRRADGRRGARASTRSSFAALAVPRARARRGRVRRPDHRRKGARRRDGRSVRPRRQRRITLFPIALGVAPSIVLLVAAWTVLPHVFTQDAAVLAQCALLCPVVLEEPRQRRGVRRSTDPDGSERRPSIARSMAVALVACAGTLAIVVGRDLGVRGAWVAIAVLIAARAATMGAVRPEALAR